MKYFHLAALETFRILQSRFVGLFCFYLAFSGKVRFCEGAIINLSFYERALTFLGFLNLQI